MLCFFEMVGIDIFGDTGYYNPVDGKTDRVAAGSKLDASFSAMPAP